MALNYSIAMMGNPMNQEEAKKAYAKAQVSQELSLKALAKRVSSQTTASRADVTAVIIATVENMIDGLRAGEQVDFGDLGKFRLQITSRGAETAEKFTAANITGVNIQFIPGEDLKNIFKRFYCSDTAHTQRGSYGLGLSIAKEIVALHQGSLRILDKEGPGLAVCLELKIEGPGHE